MSSPTNVMVVDDEVELAYLFRTFLQRSGYDTVSFSDPLLALAHYIQNPNQYSLVIIDFVMPDLDGITLAKRIREIDSNVKILIVTAFYTKEMSNDRELKEAKPSGIFQKPLRMSELRQRVIELVPQ